MSRPDDSRSAAHFGQSVRSRWRTPPDFLDAARRALGGVIHLDPASEPEANVHVQAQRFFTVNEDGLTLDWHAPTVFCNPPYGRIGQESVAGIWTRHFLEQYRLGRFNAGVLLVTNATSELWFQPLWAACLCFPRGRLRFIAPDTGRPQSGNTKGSVFAYLGDERAQFHEAFAPFGRVVAPEEPA